MSLATEDSSKFAERKRAVLRCIYKSPEDSWAKNYWRNTYRKLMEERRNEVKVLPTRSC